MSTNEETSPIFLRNMLDKYSNARNKVIGYLENDFTFYVKTCVVLLTLSLFAFEIVSINLLPTLFFAGAIFDSMKFLFREEKRNLEQSISLIESWLVYAFIIMTFYIFRFIEQYLNLLVITFVFEILKLVVFFALVFAQGSQHTLAEITKKFYIANENVISIVTSIFCKLTLFFSDSFNIQHFMEIKTRILVFITKEKKN